MADLKTLEEVAKGYNQAFDQRNKRFVAWTAGGVADTVKGLLSKIVMHLASHNEYFAQNLFVDEYFPSIMEGGVKLECKPMRSLFIRSGDMPLVRYDGGGSSTLLSEKGFQIHFSPLLNGKIHVYVTDHTTPDSEEGKYKTLAIVEDSSSLNEEKVIELVESGISYALRTSYLLEGETKST